MAINRQKQKETEVANQGKEELLLADLRRELELFHASRLEVAFQIDPGGTKITYSLTKPCLVPAKIDFLVEQLRQCFQATFASNLTASNLLKALDVCPLPLVDTVRVDRNAFAHKHSGGLLTEPLRSPSQAGDLLAEFWPLQTKSLTPDPLFAFCQSDIASLWAVPSSLADLDEVASRLDLESSLMRDLRFGEGCGVLTSRSVLRSFEELLQLSWDRLAA